MARPTPDPAFGAAFSAARFRDAIRNTMVMGMANQSSETATFRWTTRYDYNPEDNLSDPYTWTQTPTGTNSHADVVVPVAVEFTARPAGSEETPLGEFDTSRVTLTVLDEDYAQVQGADQVLLGGNVYDIQFVAPPMGLFDVDVYQLYALARDEA